MTWPASKVLAMAVAATSPVLWQLAEQSGEASVELNDEHFPLLVGRAAGQVEPKHILAMIRFFDDAKQRADGEGLKAVVIFDATTSGMPTPLVREMLVDWIGDMHKSAGSNMRVFVIAPNPLIRGVIASLRWATGRAAGIEVVPDLQQAAAAAIVALHEYGQAVPEPLARIFDK